MRRDAVGFISGVVGGLIKLLLDQFTFGIGISRVDTIGVFANMFSLARASSLWVWVLYILITGIAGWAVARLVSKDFVDSYVTAGVILGAVFWGIMNVFFVVTNLTVPTWSMGVASLLINLATHMVLGVIITYSLVLYSYEGRKLAIQ